MDRMTHDSGMIPVRWAAIMLGLLACGAELGCARMNPFLRDEPLMLGTINAPTGSSAKGAGAADTKGTTVAKGSTGRPSQGSDLYAQSFNRTRPKPDTAAPANEQPSTAEATPTVASEAAENEVHTTVLDPASNPNNPVGVVLKPPMSLRATANPAGPSPRPVASPTPATVTPPGSRRRRAQQQFETIVASAQERLDSLRTYQVAINRQERVGNLLQEPEEVLLSIRRHPRAVRLQWQEGPHQGREVIFAEQETNGLLQVNMADSKIPIPRLTLPPNSPLALRNSRHPITEAGFDTIVRNLTKTIEENRAGDESHGRISYAGIEQPAPLDHPCYKIVRVTATGETWQVFLDPESKLPTMVQANAANGDLLERYLFRSVEADPAELTASNAFDPNARWGESKGLLPPHSPERVRRATL